MNRKSRTTTDLVLPSAAAALCFLLCTVAPASAELPDLVPLPAVELGEVAPEVRSVIESAEALVGELAKADAVDRDRLAEAYGNLGRAALFYLQPELADACLLNAAALAPDDYRWHYYLGAQHHDARRLPEARDSLERALELEAGDGASLIRLGRVLLLSDQPERAAAAFESARVKKPWAPAALYGLGQAAARRGEPETAVSFFKQALEVQPEAAEIRQQLGLAYREAGRLDAAREQLAARATGQLTFPDPLIEELQNDFANSAVYRGLAAEGAGRFQEAAREYAKAVEGNPDNPVFHQALGSVLNTLGDQDGAIREFGEAVRLDPEAAMARVSLGRALAARDGFTQEVAAQFEAAREVAPNLKEARVGLGQALAKLGRFAEAVAEFVAAAETDPEDVGVRLLWGETLLLMNRPEEALPQLEFALESFPERPQVLLAYGRALSGQGADEAAREALQKVIDSDAEGRLRSPAHLELAVVLDRGGDPDTALLHYRSAADLLPEYKPPQLGLARALTAAGRHAEAADTYALITLIDPEDLAARRERARSLAAAGRVGQAIEELEAARSIAVGPDGRASLGLALAALQQLDGRTVEATELLSRLVEESPDSKDAHFNLALAFGRGGRHEEAAAHLDRVVELAPGDVQAHLLLAQLWAGKERFDRARSNLERANGLLPDNLDVMRALTYLLVGSPDRTVRDTTAALPLAKRLYEELPAPEHAALVAAALAGSERLQEAVEWQLRAVAQAEAESLPEQQLELLRRDLARYRKGT